MSNYKIKVNTEAESKEAQELFFELGYKWCDGKRVQFCWMIYLFVDEKGYITINGNDDDNFLSSKEKELTLPQLRDMVSAHRKPTEQGLISGADALRALADGEEVEYLYGDKWLSVVGEQVLITAVTDDKFKFRIKPRTITLNVEIPAPFEPKEFEDCYMLTDLYEHGYTMTSWKYCKQVPAWRTEEEIKQVVAALRGALK